ncbi:hypothetical protein M422DRAFT_24886 [Sphaerobolus stellatus SS14]|nr:hypothetical protein M422DRAFT_24886 [Sphaerobolus stellatus SS14]
MPLLGVVSILALGPIAVVPLLKAQYGLLCSTLFGYTTFYSALFISIILYRISPWHPLAKVPGPLLCRISKLWSFSIAIQGRAHKYYHELHGKYGPIVRIAPNEISVVDVALLPNILGNKGMPRGPMWDGRRLSKQTLAQYNLIGTRDKDQHALLRKTWNKAFGVEQLKDYEELVVKRVRLLAENLQKSCETSSDGTTAIDLGKKLGQFSFDFMGDLAFGGGFELLDTDDKDHVLESMDSAMVLLFIMQYLVWASEAIRNIIPFLKSKGDSFRVLAVTQARRRVQESASKTDLFYYMTEASQSIAAKFPLEFTVSSSILAMVAGSDTSATTLTICFYYLFLHPEYYKRLQEEIDGSVPEGETRLDPGMLQSLPFLNAVINETLRFQPVVPSSLQRGPAKHSGGATLGDLFIPEGTGVTIAPYALHRHPRYFSPRTEEFWPDRWIKESNDIVLEKDAFIPFSTGPANCVGKPLAQLELRYVLALLIKRFEFSFDEGYDPKEFENSLLDFYVLAKGKLPVKLKVRKH